MNLRQKYTEETGKDANRLPYQSICSVTIDYVEWLEQKVRQYNAVGRSEQPVCEKCGAKFVPHLMKPLTICDKCADSFVF